MKEMKGEQESSARSTVRTCTDCGSKKIAAAREEIARYAACIFEPADIVEVRRLPSGQSNWYQASELPEATKPLFNDNRQKEHICIGANPRRVRGGTRSKDVSCARCLFVDFDGIGPDAARDRWHDAGLPAPTLTIASGHGVHAYWRLAETITDMVLWSGLQKRLIALLGSDSAIHDPARIMRLPGFINHKRPVAMCRIIDDEQTRIYDSKSFISLMYSVVTESDYTAQYQAGRNNTGQLKKPFHSNTSAVNVAKLIADKWPGVTKGQRNCKAFQRAAFLVKNLALSEKQAWPILREWNHKNTPPLPERELSRTLWNAGVYGRQPVGSEVAR